MQCDHCKRRILFWVKRSTWQAAELNVPGLGFACIYCVGRALGRPLTLEDLDVESYRKSMRFNPAPIMQAYVRATIAGACRQSGFKRPPEWDANLLREFGGPFEVGKQLAANTVNAAEVLPRLIEDVNRFFPASTEIEHREEIAKAISEICCLDLATAAMNELGTIGCKIFRNELIARLRAITDTTNMKTDAIPKPYLKDPMAWIFDQAVANFDKEEREVFSSGSIAGSEWARRPGSKTAYRLGELLSAFGQVSDVWQSETLPVAHQECAKLLSEIIGDLVPTEFSAPDDFRKRKFVEGICAGVLIDWEEGRIAQ